MNKNHKKLILGNFSWDADTRYLHRITTDASQAANSTVVLTPKQYQLLKCLYDAAPQTLNRVAIIEHVWGTTHISTESLPQLINRTRQTLEDKDKTILVNTPGVGYSLLFEEIDIKEDSEDLSEIDAATHWFSQVNRPGERGWFALITLLSVAMLYNGWQYMTALYYQHEMQGIQHAVPYPEVQPIDNDHLSVTVDIHECIYDKTQRLLKC
ncbi:transcriptional regulator [Photobacterium aphoticum]|uniref:OmpR/PhoB-type domain-containing protein n=1 Tax=Photobacterium aphoticum TaxID=754436 RepID=A0A0J1GPM2_9GAMM|nr:helix-turn-helix domain-containing protein [Photobacterium aphoticum]KLV01693.1 hypothetical protein ABT58_04360 [Photobacterium aphoticum]PSU59267.1 winged helix family transcriptional regulator [Photobacterium aphoticum]GHA31448.1 hypothetical protein GCM10007086_00720 [Photobacterium aphoticum]